MNIDISNWHNWSY